MLKSLLSLVTAVGFLAACGDTPDDPGPGAIDTIEVEGPLLDLHPGDSIQLTARAYDADGRPVTGQAFTWATDDDAVATVTGGGLVTAVGAGEVIVSAEAGRVSGGLFLTVLDDTIDPVPVDHLSLEASEVTLAVGQTQQLVATARDAAGEPLERPVTWISTDPARVTVSATGLVTALAAGDAELIATSEGKSASALVSVTAFTRHTLAALGGAALPTLLGSYAETIPDVGTVTRTLRVFGGSLELDHDTGTYEAVVSATMSTQSTAWSVPLVVRYPSAGSVSFEPATGTFTFQPQVGEVFTGRWVANGLAVRWQPEPRTAGASTFLFTSE